MLSAVPLLAAPAAKRQTVFRQHLRLLCDIPKCEQTKDAKRHLLLGLVDYVTKSPHAFEVALYPDILAFVSANIFRDFPSPAAARTAFASNSAEGTTNELQPGCGAGETEDGTVLDSAWPHLQVVYEFLLRFVVCPLVEARVVKRYIKRAFVIRFLGLFASRDPREREYLKTILHRVYEKFVALRPFIRRSIDHIFYRVGHEGHRHDGISELLEVLGSIISGFALPLKTKHLNFLRLALIPLHRSVCLPQFHAKLSFCVSQFVEKDPSTALPIVLGLLRLWPRRNSQHQVMFLNELEDILDLTQPTEFQQAVVPLFRQISQSLSSPHFQVAERTLLFWNNGYFASLVAQNRGAVLPLIIGALRRNADLHWNTTVVELTCNVETLFAEMDPQLYAETCQQHLNAEHARVKDQARRERNWAEIIG